MITASAAFLAVPWEYTLRVSTLDAAMQAPKGSQQSAFTASNPRSAALQRAATAQVRAGGADAEAMVSLPAVSTLPASVAQAAGAAPIFPIKAEDDDRTLSRPEMHDVKDSLSGTWPVASLYLGHTISVQT